MAFSDSSVATNDPICALTATRVPIRLRASNTTAATSSSVQSEVSSGFNGCRAGLELLHRRMPLHPDPQDPTVNVVAVEHRPERVPRVQVRSAP